MAPAAVAVMAKVPRPGAVKTRLVPRLGHEGACDVYRAFIGDLDERLGILGLPVLWYHWPDDPAFAALVPGATAVVVQHGDHLGERMAAAFADAFARGFSPIVMIGADVPHVPLAWLADAVTRLQSETQVVLGPVADGGYYLVGLPGPAPALFRGIPWGSATVYEETMRRVEAQGMTAVTLPPWFDIDDADDLVMLAETIGRDRGALLPRTRAALARAGVIGD
jgi:rSAM/selenodomain-associated transferase 1